MREESSDNLEAFDGARDFLSIYFLIEDLKEMGEDNFREKYPFPFMAMKYAPPIDGAQGDDTGELTPSSEVDRKRFLSTSSMVVGICKTDRNEFSSGITVGRSRNNDIIIRAAKISKRHAVFVPGEDGRYKLVDLGSSNGTLVNATRIKRKRSIRLRTGDRITLWRYVFEFLYLDEFIKRLKQV